VVWVFFHFQTEAITFEIERPAEMTRRKSIWTGCTAIAWSAHHKAPVPRSIKFSKDPSTYLGAESCGGCRLADEWLTEAFLRDPKIEVGRLFEKFKAVAGVTQCRSSQMLFRRVISGRALDLNVLPRFENGKIPIHAPSSLDWFLKRDFEAQVGQDNGPSRYVVMRES